MILLHFNLRAIPLRSVEIKLCLCGVHLSSTSNIMYQIKFYLLKLANVWTCFYAYHVNPTIVHVFRSMNFNMVYAPTETGDCKF